MFTAAAGWTIIDHRVMFDDVEKRSFFGLGRQKHAQHRVVTTTKRHENTLLTQTNPWCVRNEDSLPRRSAATIRQVLCTGIIPGGGCVLWGAVAPENQPQPADLARRHRALVRDGGTGAPTDQRTPFRLHHRLS